MNFKNFASRILILILENNLDRERKRERMRRSDKYLLISISSVERKYMMGAYLKQRGEMDGECFCVCVSFLFCFVSFRFVSFRVARSPFEKG